MSNNSNKVTVSGDYTNIESYDQGLEWREVAIQNWKSPQLERLQEDIPFTKEWLNIIPNVRNNYISVRFLEGKYPVIFGTIIYSREPEKKENQSFHQFHYYIERNVLVTINLDFETRETMRKEDRLNMLNQCHNGADGLFVLARTVLHYLHNGMDHFEDHLRDLERSMESTNRRTVMDSILKARFELLYWNNLFISFEELVVASQEAYHKELEDNRFFHQYKNRVDRMGRLFNHYNKEIDTLISIDDAISSYRGNEIMKTLTILTAVFTPATVLGAIWGMNFDIIQLSGLKWGFVGMVAFIFLCSGGMYLWMRHKGWTGDLLRGSSSKSKDSKL